MPGQRPQPRFPEPDTEPFWEATKRHELIYQVCDSTGEVIFYPRKYSLHCDADDISWRTSKGEGEVYTFSVVMQSRHPAFADLGPYAVAYVDLDEGFRIMTTSWAWITLWKTSTAACASRCAGKTRVKAKYPCPCSSRHSAYPIRFPSPRGGRLGWERNPTHPVYRS